MNNPSSCLLKRLLTINSIKIDEKELEFQLESRPSYPSLHSATAVLGHFGIENTELRNFVEEIIEDELQKKKS